MRLPRALSALAPCLHCGDVYIQCLIRLSSFLRTLSVIRSVPTGKFPGGLEEMLAFVSYLPLSGRGEASGDGIIPRDIAVLEGSKVVELPTCKHAGTIS